MSEPRVGGAGNGRGVERVHEEWGFGGGGGSSGRRELAIGETRTRARAARKPVTAERRRLVRKTKRELLEGRARRAKCFDRSRCDSSQKCSNCYINM